MENTRARNRNNREKRGAFGSRVDSRIRANREPGWQTLSYIECTRVWRCDRGVHVVGDLEFDRVTVATLSGFSGLVNRPSLTQREPLAIVRDTCPPLFPPLNFDRTRSIVLRSIRHAQLSTRFVSRLRIFSEFSASFRRIEAGYISTPREVRKIVLGYVWGFLSLMLEVADG